MQNDLSKLPDNELLAELERREASKKEALKKKKLDYESDRDDLVNYLLTDALTLHAQLLMFKNVAVEELEAFYEKAKQYGDVRSHSKGGFSLRSNDGRYKVVLERNTKVELDERANMAEKLIREFLGDMVKKRDQKAYEIITTLLQRGKDGKFNPAAVAALLKWEDSYDDERWVRAMELFKESHNLTVIGMNVSFYRKNNEDKDEAISLSFSSLPVADMEPEDVSDNSDNTGGST
ncbi:MAG: DUF3164 family protein [Bacteroidales bacterium]|nr:DUF3164 family protein [Bacteroidales bacterium]MBN2747178.1 DUF3164 family protein [Bacteroidales bacterium]